MEVTELTWKNPRAIAKALTIVENNDEQVTSLMDQVYPKTGTSHIIGITGAPGAGKSSLVSSLIKQFRGRDLKVGIIAVDPSSPFSGGAILGDRVRMQDHSLDKGVYIRSMASRGSLGGVSVSTREAVAILDASGFDIIIIETVGVGQSEVEVIQIADTVSVVLTPNSGDSIQTMKAGIMEVGDIFVINKLDLPGADKILREIESMLDFHYHDDTERPEIVSTSAVSGQGINELANVFIDHKNLLKDTGRWEELRNERAQKQVLELIRQDLGRKLELLMERHQGEDSIMEQVKTQQISPHRAAIKLVNEVMGG
ncbi:methylmalonyl Co-A mutase-associated GTPase MeaB [Natranaerobius thermophilus]|uniref:LAO/AO transport system ATPase n=1 Tax=Natranaerobius thermophilus (strain ATCC BAA-1301 / DSM 18059 / JW/NM-WN-LF) TaxID=457570 RepID=B2A246_NATTJ|nr:methylmalonyl Co-A mutase-associated GTPase MeaB [Natranaerobius thermophilus]ACB84851.1 LAO/AO transport system ATPase [Natranaerobius thermophilus JW/NM-WN-LF]